MIRRRVQQPFGPPRRARSVRMRSLGLVTAAAMIVGLAACGDDDDDADESTVPSTAASATPSTSAGGEAATTTAANAAPDAASDALAESAAEEGSVVIYSAYDPVTNDAAVAAFEAAYPDISVELTRLTTADIMQRVDAERAGGAAGADLVIHTNREWFLDRAAEGALAPVASTNLDALPEELFFADRTSVITGLAVFGYGWNTNAVTADVTLEDMLDPQYRGRIGTYDIVAQPTFLLYYKYLEDQYGEEFLRGLAAQDPVFYPSGTPLAQAMAAGEIDVSTVLAPGNVTPDVPLTIRFPETPAATPIIGSTPTDARHPNAANLFLDFLVSPEGQEIWARDSVAVIDGVESAQFTFDEVIALNLQEVPEDFFETYLVKLQEIFGR